MKNSKASEPFTYWKRPWGRWIVLAAAAAQLICLWQSISDYQTISELGDSIFSADAFEKWKTEQLFQCSLYGIATVIFLGAFLIGTLSHSKRTATMAEGFLLFLIGISWLMTGLIFDFVSLKNWKILWLLVIGCMVAVGIYCIWESRRSEGR